MAFFLRRAARGTVVLTVHSPPQRRMPTQNTGCRHQKVAFFMGCRGLRKTVHLADLLARADVAQAKGHTKAGRGRWRARRTSPGCSARRLESISTRGAIAARRAKCAPVVQRDLQRVHQHSASKWLATLPASLLRQATKLDETLLDQLTHRAAGPSSLRAGLQWSRGQEACSSGGSVGTGSSMASAIAASTRPRRARRRLAWDLGGHAT